MKNKGQNEVPFPEPAAIPSKAMASGKSPKRSTKDLHGYPNCAIDSDEWTQ